MSDNRLDSISENSLSSEWVNAARYYLRGRRGMFLIGGILLVAALVLNWGWLAAIGIAPILLSVLPCAVMCALGLCMMHKKTADAEGRDNQPRPPYVPPKVEVLPPEPEPVRLSGSRIGDGDSSTEPSMMSDEHKVRRYSSPDRADHG
ncbi:hypothetical protein [Ferrovibrio sp.]|uniref:hypothetical protein n=1 Tax=Ferrovibrio sp. TaxID=1917215 RepID=UPI00311E277A